MRQLTPRERVLVGVGLAGLVVFGYLFGLLLPARGKLADVRRQQRQLGEKLAQAELMYREAIEGREETAALRQRFDSLMFPAADVQSGTVRAIEKLTQELGVTVTSIRPGDAESAAGAVKRPVIIKLEADLGKIVRFLYELEQPSRRLWVEGVEITSSRQTGTTLSATVYAAAYSASRGSEAGNAEA